MAAASYYSGAPVGDEATDLGVMWQLALDEYANESGGKDLRGTDSSQWNMGCKHSFQLFMCAYKDAIQGAYSFETPLFQRQPHRTPRYIRYGHEISTDASASPSLYKPTGHRRRCFLSLTLPRFFDLGPRVRS